MAEFPALPLWTDSYLADTRHLSTLEHGAYLLLMMEAWRRPACSLPDDDRLLARLSGLSIDEWQGVKDIVLSFWVLDNRSKTWKQKRLSKEREFVSDRSAKQRDRIAKRWNKTEKDDTTVIPQGIPDGYRSDTPTPTPTPISSLQSDIQKEPPPVVPKKPPKPQKRATKIPDDFNPDLQPAIDEGLQPQEAIMSLRRFKDHAQANGRTQIDWMASWRLWYRNDIAQKNRGRSSRLQAPQPTLHPVIAEAERRKAQRNAEHDPEQSRTIDHDKRPAEGRGFGNQDFLLSALGQGRKSD